jgi:hypothetical protein
MTTGQVVVLGILALSMVPLVLLVARIGASEYGFGGPETASHHPPRGRRPCCDGVAKDGCAEWWESYQWLWVRLGDGSIWRKVVRNSTHTTELGGHTWEPYERAPVGTYPSPEAPLSALAEIEREIRAGWLSNRQNARLNGWHW